MVLVWGVGLAKDKKLRSESLRQMGDVPEIEFKTWDTAAKRKASLDPEEQSAESSSESESDISNSDESHESSETSKSTSSESDDDSE